MRRPSTIELMLLATVVLWALNLTVTRYILTHGFEPLAYATVRYGAATLIFLGIALVAERTLRIRRSDLLLVVLAALCLCLNQLSFVYALEKTSASTIALILGRDADLRGADRASFGLERLSRRFWLAAADLVRGRRARRARRGRAASGDTRGTLLGIATAATWAGYSVAIAPLMERYSASRISAVVLSLGWVLIAIVGAPQALEQDYDARLGGLAAARVRHARAARDDERCSGSARCTGSAPRARRSSRTCSRSSPPSSRSCSSPSR